MAYGAIIVYEIRNSVLFRVNLGYSDSQLSMRLLPKYLLGISGWFILYGTYKLKCLWTEGRSEEQVMGISGRVIILMIILI